MKFCLTYILLFLLSSLTFSQDDYVEYYESGYDLLYWADQGNVDSVKFYVEQRKASVNFTDYLGVSPLMLAAQAGHDDVILYLFSKNASINTVDPDFKISPLIAAAKNNFLETAEILIRNGAEINHQDVFGRTALHYTCMYGFEATTDMLLYYEADVNIVDVAFYSPLAYAVQNKRDSIVMLLRLYDANPDITLRDSSTLFHIAAQSGNLFFIETFQKDIELVKNKDSLSIVEMAIVSGQSELLKWMLDNNFKMQDTINGIYTPRSFAKSSGDRKTKKLIRKMKIKDYHYPYFRRVGVGYDFIFNGDDFFMSLNSTLYEDRYGFKGEFAYMFRGGERRILYPFENNSYYQLRERRNAIYFQLSKDQKLFKTGLNSYLSFFISLRATYYWGKYDGVLFKVSNDLIASPGLGLAFNGSDNFRVFFACDYLDIPIYNTNAIFYTIGTRLMFDFNSRSKNEKYKHIIKY